PWGASRVAAAPAGPRREGPEGQGGKVGTLAYRSGNKQRSALVWTPPGYAGKGPKYPVLFLRSGDGMRATDWLDLGRAKQILDNLSARDAMEPMVVVIGDGDGPDDDRHLREAVADRYRVHRGPAHQAIAGVAEGGTRAMRA